MKLNTLKPAEGATKTSKRIGRGPGSGLGGTSTRESLFEDVVYTYKYNVAFF